MVNPALSSPVPAGPPASPPPPALCPDDRPWPPGLGGLTGRLVFFAGLQGLGGLAGAVLGGLGAASLLGQPHPTMSFDWLGPYALGSLTVGLGAVGLGMFLAWWSARRLISPMRQLAEVAQGVMTDQCDVAIPSLPPRDEMAVLHNRVAEMVRRLCNVNAELEAKVRDRTLALETANQQLRMKEELLLAHNEELAAQEAELTEYIQAIAEQQRRDRVVKWIVQSIRESLDLDDVLATTTAEVARLLSADWCTIHLYDGATRTFSWLGQAHGVASASALPEQRLPVSDAMRAQLEDLQTALIIHDGPLPEGGTDTGEAFQYRVFERSDSQCYRTLGIAAAVVVPLVHQDELLGSLHVAQAAARVWTGGELDALRDIASQVSIAVRQAMLYHQAREATRLKSEFLANMSHELRTPLNAIIGFSEMIESETYGTLNTAQRRYIVHVVKSAQHLLALVNDILDLSKVESGTVPLHYEVFDLAAALQDVVATMRPMAQQKHLTVTLDMDATLGKAYADPSRVKQILFNLLSNAVKFTEDGGAITLVADRGTAAAGERERFPQWPKDQVLMLSVRDTGIGIAADDQPRVFQAFHQLDASYARRQEGTGLGLALTRQLVSLHGGVIELDSLPGRGSTFTVWLPCLLPVGQAAPRPNDPRPTPATLLLSERSKLQPLKVSVG